MVGLKGKKEGESGWNLHPLEGSYERGNVASYQTSFPCWESAETYREGVKAHRGVKQLACGRWSRDRPAETLLVTLVHFHMAKAICWSVQMDRLSTQTSVDRPGEEDSVWLFRDSPRGLVVVWPATGGVSRRTQPRSTVGAPMSASTGREGRGLALAVIFHPAYSGLDSTTKSSKSQKCQLVAPGKWRWGRAEILS